MFTTIGPLEIAVVAVLALLVLGPRKLPDAGRSLGRGLREFKDAVGGVRATGDTTELGAETTSRDA